MKQIASALTILTLSLAAGVAQGQETLQPFTHVARIPAGFDTGSIRFQTAKMVRIPATLVYTTNPEYCKDLAFRDPGGSMYCPSARTGDTATAYELTFSVTGTPLASDEYGNRNFTFHVYFAPDELAPDVRQAISNGKRSRSDAVGSFKVSTSRELVRQNVVDEAASHFCAGNFMDGAWINSDANCRDQVYYKAIDAPSDYITVRIAPNPVRTGLASANQVATAITSKK
jgi:hypothetical protein